MTDQSDDRISLIFCLDRDWNDLRIFMIWAVLADVRNLFPNWESRSLFLNEDHLETNT